MVIWDCVFVPFNYAYTCDIKKARPPVDEDTTKTHHQKVRNNKKFGIKDMTDTEWLKDVALDQRLSPKPFRCTICRERGFTGQTLCFVCGGKIMYDGMYMAVPSHLADKFDDPWNLTWDAATTGKPKPGVPDVIAEITASPGVLPVRPVFHDEKRYKWAVQFLKQGLLVNSVSWL